MQTIPWKRCESTTSGGNPFFFIRRIDSYGPGNWGFARVVWDRRVEAYAATLDQKYGDHRVVGYYSDPDEAQSALNALL